MMRRGCELLPEFQLNGGCTSTYINSYNTCILDGNCVTSFWNWNLNVNLMKRGIVIQKYPCAFNCRALASFFRGSQRVSSFTSAWYAKSLSIPSFSGVGPDVHNEIHGFVDHVRFDWIFFLHSLIIEIKNYIIGLLLFSGH